MRTCIALCLIAFAAAATGEEGVPPRMQETSKQAAPAQPLPAERVPEALPASSPATAAAPGSSAPAASAPVKAPLDAASPVGSNAVRQAPRSAAVPAPPPAAHAAPTSAPTPARSAATGTPSAGPQKVPAGSATGPFLPAASSVPPAAPVAPPVTAPASAPAPLVALRGQLSLTSGGRPLRADEAVDAVVYFRSATPVPVVLPPQPLVIATERKTFVPRVLAVPVGASVRFPNKDPILHNVFSTAKEASFDLGLYGRSEGDSYRFTQAGVIRVYCNVHHAMVAHVLVLDTPFFTRPDAQGRFRLVGLPAEAGELFVWHERAQLWRAAVTPGSSPDVAVKLELSRRRVPPHLNKAGQPYRRTRPDEY